MSQDTAEAAGASQGGAAANPSMKFLEDIKIVEKVANLIASDGCFSGTDSNVEDFLDNVDTVFADYRDDIPEKLQCRCVRQALNRPLMKAWNNAVKQNPSLSESWETMKPWFKQFKSPENPRLAAVKKLRKLRVTADSLVAREFDEIFTMLPEMTLQLRNLFLVAATDESVSLNLESMHGEEFESWGRETFTQRLLPLCRQHQQQQQRKAGQNRSSGKEQAASYSYDKKKSSGTTNFVKMLEDLDAVKVLDGTTYKPKDVAALKASLKDASKNPDHAKLRLFLDHNRLCYICRDKGHRSSRCPDKNSSRAAQE